MRVRCSSCNKFVRDEDMDNGQARFYSEPESDRGPEINEWTCPACVPLDMKMLMPKVTDGKKLEAHRARLLDTLEWLLECKALSQTEYAVKLKAVNDWYSRRYEQLQRTETGQ